MLKAEPETYVPVELSQLHPNRHNVRRSYPRIKELAESIAKVGLLQNLVVIDLGDGYYEVKAGERRLRALRLLAEQGRWTEPVPCIIIRDEVADVANLVENTARERVPVWREGLRICELLDSGLWVRQIAEHVGKSESYVKYAKSIADGVHPDLFDKLDRIDPELLSSRILRQLARIRNADGSPDYERQLECLTKVTRTREVMKRVKKPRGRYSAKYVKDRVYGLDMLPVDPRIKPVVDAVARYLKGETKEIVVP